MFEASAFWLVCCGAIHVSSSSFARSKFAVEASKVQNVSVALLHSVVMFFGAVKYLWPRKQLSLELFSIPSVQPNTNVENFYCEIMIGYLLYDVVCSVQQGEGLVMLLHHVLGLASHSSLRYCNIGGPYMMWVHFAEGSTPLFHLGWLLSHVNVKFSEALVQTVRLAFVIMFFFCRVVSAPLCLHSVWKSGYMWPPFEALHKFVLCITLAFVCINYFWWVVIVQKVYRTLRNTDDRKQH